MPVKYEFINPQILWIDTIGYYQYNQLKGTWRKALTDPQIRDVRLIVRNTIPTRVTFGATKLQELVTQLTTLQSIYRNPGNPFVVAFLVGNAIWENVAVFSKMLLDQTGHDCRVFKSSELHDFIKLLCKYTHSPVNTSA